MSDESPQPSAIRSGAGKGGKVPPVEHRWKPGTAPNPGGHPKGFFPLSRAYEDIMSWPREVKAAFLAGKEIPAKYRRKLKPAHDVARAQLLRAEDPGCRAGVAAAEAIADRTEGKVTQKTEAVTQSLEEAAREVAERIRARQAGRQ